MYTTVPATRLKAIDSSSITTVASKFGFCNLAALSSATSFFKRRMSKAGSNSCEVAIFFEVAIGAGIWGPVYYNYNKEPTNSIGNYLSYNYNKEPQNSVGKR